MPEYRRWYVPGGTFFFTLVTHRRFVGLGEYTLDWGAEDPTPGYDDPEWGE